MRNPTRTYTVSKEKISLRQSQRQQKVFFLDATWGLETTYVNNAISKFLKLKGKNFIAFATSAAAAQLFCKGSTAHFIFIILIPFNEDSTCTTGLSSHMASELQRANLII